MDILITGAAGNLGGHLARHLLGSPHDLRLMVHRKDLPMDLAKAPGVQVHRADLANPGTLRDACDGVDAIVHLAGVLFAPRPGSFLPTTNVQYVKNLLDAAVDGGAKKIILVSFPHTEGETTPERPATDRLDATPASHHARTRLLAEQEVLATGSQGAFTPVVLRAGMVYGRDVLLIEAARRLAKRRLLAVWREPTWTHLLALPDFLDATQAAIEKPEAHGIYNAADDAPLPLQEFLDRACDHWGVPRPWRLPRWTFPLAGALCEGFATALRSKSPLTRDFIRAGMSSSVADTTRMKKELLPRLKYPSLDEGIRLL